MHEYGHYPDPYLPEIPPWLAEWFEDQKNPYPRDGRFNFYNPNAGQQVGPLEVPFNSVAAYLAQKNGMGAETPSHTVGRQVGANEYPSGAMLKFPSWMEGPPGQMLGKNYAQLLMSYLNQGQTDGPPNPFSELKANPLMDQLLAAKAGRGPNPYLPSSQNYIPDTGSRRLAPPLPIRPPGEGAGRGSNPSDGSRGLGPPPFGPMPKPIPGPMPPGNNIPRPSPLPPKFPPMNPSPKPIQPIQPPNMQPPLQPNPKFSQPIQPEPKPKPKPKQMYPPLDSYIPRYERD